MIEGLLQTLGGVGLFLLGMVVMTQGLKDLVGDALVHALARFTRSPYSGALTGSLTTALIQSSSATTVAAVGFVGAGLLTFPQALGVIFGANLGTTITGWLVAFFGFKLDLGMVAPPLIFVGVLLILFGKGRVAAIGRGIAGFALVFLGIGVLKQGMTGLEGVITPTTFPDDSLGGRALLVLIGMVVTLVTQSSSAGVATAITGVSVGALSFTQAAAMVIGMDIGTTFTAFLATIGASTQARRTGYAHVTYNLMTGVVAFFLIQPYTYVLQSLAASFLESDPELALVGFHTTFNGLGVIAALPFTAAFAAFITRIVPERGSPLTRGLEPALVSDPALALAAALGALGEITRRSLRELGTALKQTPSMAQIVDRFAPCSFALAATREYLGRIHTSPEQGSTHVKNQALMHATDHLERLISRSERRVPGREVRADPEIAHFTDRLVQSSQESGPITPEEIELRKELWQALDDADERYRHEVLDRASTGKLNATAALARLDEMRRLRRLAYHAWRIVHHLHRARFEDGVETEEGADREGLEIED